MQQDIQTQRKQTFHFNSSGKSENPAQSLQTFSLSVELWPLRKKWKKGLRFLFLFWLGALLSLFIPILHFILVPLFLFLGLGGFLFFFRKEDCVVHQDISCPLCHKDFSVSSVNVSQFSSLVCSHCYEKWDLH